MPWTVEFLDESVEDQIDSLSLDIKAKFTRIVALIESKGLPQVREPYVKHLQGRLWEMRMKGKDGIARAVYVTCLLYTSDAADD